MGLPTSIMEQRGFRALHGKNVIFIVWVRGQPIHMEIGHHYNHIHPMKGMWCVQLFEMNEQLNMCKNIAQCLPGCNLSDEYIIERSECLVCQ